MQEAVEWTQTEERVDAHYSSISLHRKCPQAWYYRYGLGLGRMEQESAPERDFGSWFHALRAAHSLDRGRRLGSLKEAKDFRALSGMDKFDAKTVVPKDVMNVAEAWWEKQSFETKEEWVERLGDELPQRLRTAFTRWHDEYGPKLKTEHPIAVEMFWKRELPRPAGDKAWDALADGTQLPTMWLLGYIDEVYLDLERNIVVARDIKTTKSLGTQNAVDDMMDSQLELYAWGAGQKLHEWDLPQIRAVAYDRIKSNRPSDPQLTLAGSLSKSVTNFDVRTYTEWASKDTMTEATFAYLDDENKPFEKLDEQQQQIIRELPEGRLYGKLGEFYVTGARKGEPKFGVYQPEQEVIDRLTTPSWKSQFLQRTLVPLSSHVVRAHLRAAVDSCTDIWRTQKRAEITLEAARNLSRGNCQWCDYASICRAQMIGGPQGQYELAEHNLVANDGRRLIGVD